MHDWLHFGTKPKRREREKHTTQPSKYVMLSQICTMFSACTHPNALVVYYTLFFLCLPIRFRGLSLSLSLDTHTRTHIRHSDKFTLSEHFGAATLKKITTKKMK